MRNTGVSLALALCLFASRAVADGAAHQVKSKEIGDFIVLQLTDPPQTCTYFDIDTQSYQPGTEYFDSFVNQSNALLPWDLSVPPSPGVYMNFDYYNPCAGPRQFGFTGTGTTDPTSYPAILNASQYITFSGAVDTTAGGDGKLAWARIDSASMPIYLDSDGCYVQAIITLNASAVAPLQTFPPANYTTFTGPGFTRTHFSAAQRVAAATGTLTFAKVNDGLGDEHCTLPFVGTRNVTAISYYPWGDSASVLYSADSTDITVTPRGH